MTTANQLLAQLSGVKADIKTALVNKGVDMNGVPFTRYAEKINNTGSGGEIEIIFQNTQATSNFGATTIAHDLSLMDFINDELILKFKRTKSESVIYEIRLNKGENNVCIGNSSQFYWRKFTVNDTGINVGTGGETSTYPKITDDNQYIIPLEIRIQKSAGSLSGKTYLFKDGILSPLITLPSSLAVSNGVIYTNSSGVTNWSHICQIESNKTAFVKCIMNKSTYIGGNEPYLDISNGKEFIKLKFAGDNSYNGESTIGLAFTESNSLSFAFYTIANAMGIKEIWYE